MFELRRLNRQIESNSRDYKIAIGKAESKNTSKDEKEKLIHEFAEKRYELETEIMFFVTEQLIRKARSLLLPMPDSGEGGMWEKVNSRSYLTEAGIAKVRSTIREEEAARRKIILDWVSVGAVITGIIGAATGLLAIILK
ncbi:MAG: hypothetical protein C4542_01845 [Dehalococcoidia bacterium]|nr:MAG: hypothetical protein C4542_01845 [Dehalococcoidia bacterium]